MVLIWKMSFADTLSPHVWRCLTHGEINLADELHFYADSSLFVCQVGAWSPLTEEKRLLIALFHRREWAPQFKQDIETWEFNLFFRFSPQIRHWYVERMAVHSAGYIRCEDKDCTQHEHRDILYYHLSRSGKPQQASDLLSITLPADFSVAQSREHAGQVRLCIMGMGPEVKAKDMGNFLYKLSHCCANEPIGPVEPGLLAPDIYVEPAEQEKCRERFARRFNFAAINTYTEQQSTEEIAGSQA